MKKSMGWIALLAMLSGAAAQAAETASRWEALDYQWGGDVRVRQIYFDEIPIIADPPGVTRGGDNHFFRIRTRLYDKLDIGEQVTLFGRLVNEFRWYDKPDNDSSDWPDELLVDNLYLEVRNLFDDRVDLRIGRQDLIYGTGKLILEGTPKDGSRTIFFDAVKLTLRPQPDTSIDLLGIYNRAEDDLVINSQDRDLTGQTARYDDITESGGGLYLKNGSLTDLPFEVYYLYKEESSWTRHRGEESFAIPRTKVHTAGFRAMPKLSETVSANIELAGQRGERGEQDLEGWMVDALVSWRLDAPWKPVLGAGLYALSGNDPETADDEGWNPLWARWPQYSELYVYAWDAESAGRWSNVTLPYLSLTLQPGGRMTRAHLLAGPLGAMEKDGPGGGSERGWLYTLRGDFALASNLLSTKDRLFGHLVLEVLEPGNYYTVDNTSYFARWELCYAF